MPISDTLPQVERPAHVVAAEQAAEAARQAAARVDSAVLFGGESHRVVMRDGADEAVVVRLVSVRELPRFVALQDDEPAVLEMVCDRPQGWADRLTPDAHFLLIDRARALNFPVALRWTASQVDMQRRLADVIERADAKA